MLSSLRSRRRDRSMRLSSWVAAVLVAGMVVALSPLPVAAEPGAEQQVVAPRLVARATLSADYLAPGRQSGADAAPANGRTGPFDGQVIPGFSAAVANEDGTFWAMPDNGFGTKANSTDFLLRIYLVRPRWGRGESSGSIQIIRYLTLSDPRNMINFPIVRESSRKRLLTGGDFDVESLQRMPDGTFWIGEEFGPFLLHVDRRGRLLSRPVSSPLGKSPQHPRLGESTPTTGASGGFEATALSPNGRYLYPILEKSLVDDSDPRRRVISEFDTRAGRYTGRRWDYRVDTDANLVADAQMLSKNTMLVLERDDFDGDAAVTKRIYRVDLRRTDRSDTLAKALQVDLLKLDNPGKVGEGGGWGTGDPFSFGLRSVETLVPLPDGRIVIANDNNYPGDAARQPGTPDDTEMILLDPDATISVTESEHTVIAHRGASGYRPEHTLAAYALAIRQCADVIEPDIVMTKDDIPVARHENDISDTTDVADRDEFDDRETTKIIDGSSVTGWFTEDFTLAELRTLRAKERLPTQRPANTAYDGRYPIPTLAEVLDLARHSKTCSGQPVGVTPETKHPTYFTSIGHPFDGPLLDALSAADLNSSDAPVMIQSFETTNLQQLNQRTEVSLSQLINCSGRPYDLRVAGDRRTYADLAKPAGLRTIAGYADAVGLCKDVMIPRYPAGHPEENHLMGPTPVIADAHAAGLTVIGWTFRRENRYLPAEFRSGPDLNAPGNLAGEIQVFLGAGMDGYFTDNPDVGSSLDIT
jgi:glycerophosphoryl diester phosphodiesterase